ncbi:13438_t:CDS:10 [Ambispora gerdemannii]|uniref:13438_t:CDS:1 n=1 Tax=Ambispora gerdemannii TaxID=144530 RepID=A0A9N8ZEV8_9GLOM|nr:13438_t:CDS:10 [Ambispora gerdemannii]
MILDDSSSKALKEYLIQQLEPISDAEPAVLAEYVLALLKHDVSSQDLRQLCISQLDDFLKEETEPFVRKLFNELFNKEYLGERISSPSTNHYEPTPKIPYFTPAEKKSSKTLTQQEDSKAEVVSQKTKVGDAKKRADSEASEDDDDRNFKHRERDGENRDDHRRHAERQSSFSSRDEERETTKNKRIRGDSIPTGPAAEYNNNFQDDRSSKRRRDESEEDFRSNKMPRSNIIGPNNQNISSGTGNNRFNGGPRRLDYERNNRPSNRNFIPITPNPSVSNISGPGRWGNEWGANGINGLGDRFDDRKMRGGRINDRGSARGRPLVVNRGGFPDIRPNRQSRLDDVPLNRPFEIIPPITGAPLAANVGMMGAGRPPFFMGAGGVHNQFEIEPPFQNQQSSRSMTPNADAYDPERAALSRPEDLISPVTGENKDIEIQSNSDISKANSSLSLSPTTPNTPHYIEQPSPHSTRNTLFRGRARGRGARGGINRAGSGSGQANKNSTLVVENIPAENCTIDKVNEFFKKFGTIININVDPSFQKAIIQFNTSQEASKAYNSPEPIFDNRFVKVYWHKADKEEHPVTNPLLTKQAVVPATKQELASQSSPTEIQVLSKKREELIQRQIEEQHKLIELAKKKTGDAKGREELFGSLSKISEDIKKDTSNTVIKPIITGSTPLLSSGTLSKSIMEEKERERLDRELDLLSKLNESGGAPDSALGKLSLADAAQAKSELAKVEGESTTTIGSTNNLTDSTFYKSRGRGGIFGYRSRARGLWPRVRGGGVTRSYKLDNRSTKLIVKEIPSGSQDTLRSYFEQFGEVESLNFIEEARSAIVQYKNRHEAEQALIKGRNIPDVGNVSINWHIETNANANTNTTAPTSESKNTAVERNADTNGDSEVMQASTSATQSDDLSEDTASEFWSQKTALEKRYQKFLDEVTPYTGYRWFGTVTLVILFVIRIFTIQGFYIVTYALGIYLLNLFLAFLQPKFDPSLELDIAESEIEEGPSLPTKADEEFRPFIRRLPEFKFW